MTHETITILANRGKNGRFAKKSMRGLDVPVPLSKSEHISSTDLPPAPFYEENFLSDRPKNYPFFKKSNKPSFDTAKFMRSIKVDDVPAQTREMIFYDNGFFDGKGVGEMLVEEERNKFWVRGFLCACVIWGVVLFLARV